jgi:hypothetical protein
MKKFYSSQALKRRLIILVIISLLLASAIELYTFGIPSDFILRWLRTFFVIFTMISVTVLGIVPGINWMVNRAAQR